MVVNGIPTSSIHIIVVDDASTGPDRRKPRSSEEARRATASSATREPGRGGRDRDRLQGGPRHRRRKSPGGRHGGRRQMDPEDLPSSSLPRDAVDYAKETRLITGQA